MFSSMHCLIQLHQLHFNRGDLLACVLRIEMLAKRGPQLTLLKTKVSGNLSWICKWISRLCSSTNESKSYIFRWNEPMCFGKILVGYWSLQFIWVDFPFQPTTLVPPPFWHLLASRGYHFRSVFFLEAKKVLQFFSLSTKYVVPSIFWKKMFYQNYFSWVWS